MGEYDIVASLSDEGGVLGNYSVTTNGGTLTVTAAELVATADDKSRSYGSANPNLTGSVTGIQNGDNITASYSTDATAASAVGSYDIVPSLNDPDGKLSNYNVTINNGTLSVTAVTLTVSADNKAREYGDSNPTLTGSLSGLVNGDNITATYSTAADEASAAGFYDIDPSLVDPDGKLGNYSVASNTGTLSVTPAPLTVSADNASRNYGADDPEFAGSINGIKNSDDITATYTTSATTGSAVGPYDIVPALVDPDNKAGNYNVTLNNGTLTITPAVLTGKADDKSRAYGEENPEFTVTYTGFVNGETASIVTGTLEASTTATQLSPIGEYPITVSGQTAPNYTINYEEGTLTITAFALVVTADDQSRTYGAANSELTGSITGVRTGDDITASFNTTATESSPVGEYLIVAGLNDPDGKAANYSVTLVDGTLAVTPAPLTLVVDNKIKVQGSANPTFTGVLTGVQNDDDITAEYSTAADTDSPSAEYPITGSLTDNGTGALTNYTQNITHGVLKVVDAPTILVQPSVPPSVPQGGSYTLSVVAEGGDLNYQWKLNNAAIPGASGSSYAVMNIQPATAGVYTVDIWNDAGVVESTSVAFSLVLDGINPKLMILTPKNKQVVTNANLNAGLFTISGTSLDTGSVARVEYSLNGADYVDAAVQFVALKKASNWNAQVELVKGTNTLTARTFDVAGNTHSVTVLFFYHVASPLTVHIVGSGAVKYQIPANLTLGGNTNMLFIGRTYKIKALQNLKSGYILTNWTTVPLEIATPSDILETNNLQLTFTMRENMHIYVNFVPNAFQIHGDGYTGLFHESAEDGGVKHHSAGHFYVKVTTKGSYSGKLFVDGDSIPFTGLLRMNGSTPSTTVSRVKWAKDNLTLQMQLSFDSNENLTGTLSDPVAGWTSEITADRLIWSKTNANPGLAAYTNIFTMVFPGNVNPADGPVGHSHFIATVLPTGEIKTKPFLADGQKAKIQKSYISKNGEWAFYSPLYPLPRIVNGKNVKQNRGSMMGWLTFAPNTEAVVKTNLAPLGLVDWIKVDWTNTTGVVGGFTNQITAKSSLFVPHLLPLPRALDMSSGSVTLDGGGLSAPIVANVDLLLNKFVTTNFDSTNKFKPAFNAKTSVIKRQVRLSKHDYHAQCVGCCVA